MKKTDVRKKRRSSSRQRNTAKFQIAKDTKIEYKDIPLLQKFLNDRGKMLPRRITGVTAKQQRRIVDSIKRARFLALLPVGGVRL